MLKFCLAALLSSAAWAQDSVLSVDVPQSWLKWKVEGVIGPGYLAEPFILGSASVQPTFWPFLDLTIADRVSVHADDGIDIAVFKSETFETGPRASYSWGRDGSYYRSADREEITPVAESVFAGWGAWVDLRFAELSVSYDLSLEGRGGLANASLNFHLLKRDRFEVELTPDLSWASERYMRTFFGVTKEDAQATGLDVYTPGAGFQAAGSRLSARYRPGFAKLVVAATLGYHRLLDQARRSSLNEAPDHRSLFLAVGYEI